MFPFLLRNLEAGKKKVVFLSLGARGSRDWSKGRFNQTKVELITRLQNLQQQTGSAENNC